ncbi:hypothetical protein GM418_14610 [Maribellus comscasis]|uniref:Uncharacterized protein n=1 Tax=Maribellus comscasis TaxID=2681766 RepID=A0A6I6K4E4_9BACT|nr:hypothetical protein [Maribellus comscasis]QGY44854.1 hypothetical protein GM418_14610 [Maribellus comscasis]
MQNSSNGSEKNDCEIVQIQDCDGFEIKIPKEEIGRFMKQITRYMDENSLLGTFFNLHFMQNENPSINESIKEKREQIDSELKKFIKECGEPADEITNILLDFGDEEYQKYMLKNLVQVLATFFEETFLKNAEELMDYPDVEVKALISKYVSAIVALRTEFYNKVFSGVLRKSGVLPPFEYDNVPKAY